MMYMRKSPAEDVSAPSESKAAPTPQLCKKASRATCALATGAPDAFCTVPYTIAVVVAKCVGGDEHLVTATNAMELQERSFPND
ncbi:MAG: hypothetical protein ACJ796_16560 [Gemmatimonadaceae bacterium]